MSNKYEEYILKKLLDKYKKMSHNTEGVFKQ